MHEWELHSGQDWLKSGYDWLKSLVVIQTNWKVWQWLKLTENLDSGWDWFNSDKDWKVWKWLRLTALLSDLRARAGGEGGELLES